jgi:hypothetical protein
MRCLQVPHDLLTPSHALQGGELESLQLAGARDRSVFNLNVTLNSLQVVLNYEGSGGQALSRASMDEFSFALDVRTDSSLKINAGLGNIQAVSGELGPGCRARWLAACRCRYRCCRHCGYACWITTTCMLVLTLLLLPVLDRCRHGLLSEHDLHPWYPPPPPPQFDCTVPEGHPYRQACGLRPGSSSSLISLEFHSMPPHYRDQRVPAGCQYYTLQAKLSELELVFLYRFLSENLQYISTMLAMRLPAVGAPKATGEGEAAATAAAVREAGLLPVEQAQQVPAAVTSPTKSAQAEPSAQPTQQPFMLLLDVEMSAPVIRMPRSTNRLVVLLYLP